MKNKDVGLIIFDLDNTLVDKNAVFEKAQNQMIQIIKGKKATKRDMRILREIDSILIIKNKTHLYPFETLALSLWFYYHKDLDIEESIQKSLEVLESSCERTEEIEKAVSLAENASAIYNDILENTPAELYDGAEEVLQTLKEMGYRLVLLSEGSQVLQEKTLETHGLPKYFADIVLCSRKDKQCFLDIKNRWNRPQDGKELAIIVVGDGIDRDIEPGNEIGATTVWKPGDFNPGTPSRGMKHPDYYIKDIKSLLNIVNKAV